MKTRYVLALIVFAALAALYYTFNPGTYHLFPACPVHKYAGIDCPGCGSQRAVHALLHGDVVAAMDYNFLLVLSLPFLLIHFLLKLASILTGRDMVWKIWYKPATPIVILVLVVIFWILRNIPAAPFSYLAA